MSVVVLVQCDAIENGEQCDSLFMSEAATRVEARKHASIADNWQRVSKQDRCPKHLEVSE